MTESRKAVRAGARLLKSKFSRWEFKINLRRLDVGNPFNCILGQLAGSYIVGKAILGLDIHRDVSQYGFHLHPGLESFRKMEESKHNLGRAWKELILMKRKRAKKKQS